MKLKRIIISVSVTTALILLVIVRLVSNKRSFNEELKMVSESNTSIPVLTDTVKYKHIATSFSVNGTFSPYKEISIAAETQGKIISISSKVGDRVITGQVMASIDNEISAEQLELAKFNLEKAGKDMKRLEQLSQGEAATIQQYEAAEQNYKMAQSAYTSAKVENENASIIAPFDGIITKRYFDKGAYLSPGLPVFDIVEIDRLKFIAKLSAGESEKTQKDQNVKLSADAYPGIVYDGQVSSVSIKADLSKRYDVEIEVNNRTNKLIKPGMFGTVIFPDNTSEQTLVIPRNAIAGSIKNPEIFLVKGDSVILQKITVTPLNEKYVMVNAGLTGGDIVVTSGQISLVNGSKIKLNN